MSKILVTGAGGFVGRRLCVELVKRGSEVRGTVRDARRTGVSAGETNEIGSIDGDTDWKTPLIGVDAVVHLAARVHMMRDVAADPLREFRRINVFGTLNLARQAAASGVRRFVFISSIKVNGESTLPGRPFLPDDAPAPTDPYGISKHEAEEGLRDL